MSNIKANANRTEIELGEFIIFYGSFGSNFIWDNDIIDKEQFYPTFLGEKEFSVSGTNSDGKLQSSTIIINVKEKIKSPQLMIGEDKKICCGNNVVLNAFFVPNGQSYKLKSHIWDDGVRNIGKNLTITVSPLQTTTYTFTGIDNENRVNSTSVKVVVFPKPDIEVCEKDGRNKN
jgi:hypothetical protein